VRSIGVSADYFHTWLWAGNILIGIIIRSMALGGYPFMISVPVMLIDTALIFNIGLCVCGRSNMAQSKVT
jgi:hypothetical protein